MEEYDQRVRYLDAAVISSLTTSRDWAKRQAMCYDQNSLSIKKVRRIDVGDLCSVNTKKAAQLSTCDTL